MAEASAKLVFSSTHTIRSAGAETDVGLPAAKDAITALAELGLDLSAHTTTPISDVDLSGWDIIGVFRPSMAEGVELPKSAKVAFLDVADPYNKGLPAYRTAARQIQLAVRALHASDALARLTAAPGSHLGGVFSNAAKEVEKQITQLVSEDLNLPVQPKATLGQLIGILKAQYANQQVRALQALIPELETVNDAWVKVKHRQNPPAAALLEALKAVSETYKHLGVPLVILP